MKKKGLRLQGYETPGVSITLELKYLIVHFISVHKILLQNAGYPSIVMIDYPQATEE